MHNLKKSWATAALWLGAIEANRSKTPRYFRHSL
jgi:hypothetical protein